MYDISVDMSVKSKRKEVFSLPVMKYFCEPFCA